MKDDDSNRRAGFGWVVLIAAAVTRLGFAAVSWAVDLAHRAFAAIVVAIVVVAVARLAQKS